MRIIALPKKIEEGLKSSEEKYRKDLENIISKKLVLRALSFKEF